MTPLPSVLIAEDDESDVLFLKRAFAKVQIPNPLEFVPDGMAVIERLTQNRETHAQRLPALVLLDMKMPRRNGLQVVEWMRSQPVIRATSVLIFSSSANHSDIENAYEAGVNAFLLKPASSSERVAVAAFIKEWLRLVQAPLAASEDMKAAISFRTFRDRKP